MGVMGQFLRLLGLSDLPQADGAPLGKAERRELAGILRELPRCYDDRLPGRVLERVTNSAASGQWEKAADQLVMALYIRAAPVTTTERAELYSLLRTLDVPTRRVGTLPVR